MKFFQVAVLLVFGFSLLVGVLIFSGILPGFSLGGSGGSGGVVVMWGGVPHQTMQNFVRDFNFNNRDNFTLEYVAKNPATLESEYIEALARGRGPDLILVNHEMIVRLGDTFAPVPYDVFSERDFRNTFTEGAEIFLSPSGALALPMTVDPLVMYYNRNIFNSEGLASVPGNWSEFINTIGRLTRVDDRRNILRAGAPMGQFANFSNAKEVLATLILQSGNPIVGIRLGSYESVMRETPPGVTISPAASAVDFFVQFADQSRSTYTWSRAMPEARDAFVSENLAIYFGFIGEAREIMNRNPNINIDVALMPQRDNVSNRVTYGRFGAVAVTRASRNQNTAYQVAFVLANRETSYVFAGLFNNLAPARRDLLSFPPPDAFGQTLYRSALISRAWLDPHPRETRTIFASLSDDVLLRRKTSRLAVMDTDDQITRLFNR